MIANGKVIELAGRFVAALAAFVFIFDIITGGALSELSRIIIMAIAAIAYMAVFLKQCKISYEYEGWPVSLPIAFRWVVASFFGTTGVLIIWFLTVAIWPHVFSATISSIFWSLFAITTLWFFGRWLAIGRPTIAGPGETGGQE